MNPTTKDRGIFLHRDSGGKAEMTPAQYVGWAQKGSKELNLSFDGTPERINAMIREGRFAYGDLFLDYDVKGNLLSRNGLNALINEAVKDPRVTMYSSHDAIGLPGRMIPSTASNWRTCCGLQVRRSSTWTECLLL